MSELKFYKHRRRLSKQKKIRIAIYAGIGILVALFAVLVVLAFGKRITMNDSSMEPTIENGQGLVVDRISYKIFKPGHNDIIAFKTSNGKRVDFTIKRVVAVPGDIVQIRKGKLYVNGREESSRLASEYIKNAGLYEEEQTIPADQYFVMGDNRNNSEDSRFEGIGCVKRSDIYGKIWFKVSPINKIGFLF